VTSPTNRAASVTGVVFKIVGIFVALYLVRGAWLGREQAQSITASYRHQVDERQQVLDSHDAYVEQLKDMRVVLEALRRQLPAKLDGSSIAKTLQDQAALADIELESIRIGKERVREGFYVELPVALVLQGPTVGFFNFMGTVLPESPLRMAVDMRIEPTDAATTRAAVTLNYFRYLEEAE
jgi:Tfp pilus assembly protein PilO